jgi:hypothetical protein
LVVTGSFGFALQGVPIEPNDIDIKDKKGDYEIESLFCEFVIKPVRFSSAEKIRSYFGTLMIDGIEIEIMGDIQKRLAEGVWEEPVDLKQYKRVVEIEGVQVPVLSFEYEYQAYLKLGRIEKAKMLRKWLDSVHGSSDNTSPNS